MQAFTFNPPDDLIKEIESLKAEEMAKEMLRAASKVVEGKVKAAAMRAFKHDASKIVNCMCVTSPYETPTDGGLNIKIGFTGYFINSDGYKTPAPLVVNVMEYGASNFNKHPFFRKCFRYAEITKAMKEAEAAFLEGLE